MKISSSIVNAGSNTNHVIQGSWVPSFNEYCIVLEDFLNMSVRRKDHWWSFTDLQINLFMIIAEQLSVLKSIKEARILGQNGEEINLFEAQVRTMINALMQVADGIAYRFLDYNFALFTCLQTNKTTPYSLLEEGTKHVLEIMESLNTYKGPDAQILLCDLNSITNIGDLIVKGKEEFEIIEVKKGRARGKRIQRQRERMQSLVEFINTKIGQFGDKNVTLIKLPCRRHELSHLEKCLKESEKTGVAFAQINDYLRIQCIDTKHLTNMEFKTDLQSLLSEQLNDWKDSNIFVFDSLRYREYSGRNVPLTVFPIETSLIVDILMGNKIYLSVINFDILRSYVQDRGWGLLLAFGNTELSLEDMGEKFFGFYKINNMELNSIFPIEILMSMMMELVQVESYLELSDEIIKARSETGNWIPYFENEQNIWK